MNNKHISALELGASLYVPATRGDLVAVANGERYPFLRSVIFCTEDSILPHQLEIALGNLRDALTRLSGEGPLLFIRPRDPHTLARILALPGIEQITGFVLPKSTAESVAQHIAHLPANSHFHLMPTLETREVFDPQAMRELRRLLSAPQLRERILALRVGGNDLLNLLGIRRRPGRTIYDTAIGTTIAALVTTFKPFGFHLTAPVFDDFGDPETLQEEVLRDLDHGLSGKTAIHPTQIAAIEQHYRVPAAHLEMAQRIVDEEAPAVFQMDRVMCEPATHVEWARTTIARATIYGTEETVPFFDRRFAVT